MTQQAKKSSVILSVEINIFLDRESRKSVTTEPSGAKIRRSSKVKNIDSPRTPVVKTWIY
jgi:hypothetical protein